MQRLKHWPNLFHYILGVSGKMADACGPALIELFIIYVSLFNKTTGENWLHEEERSFFIFIFCFCNVRYKWFIQKRFRDMDRLEQLTHESNVRPHSSLSCQNKIDCQTAAC